MSSRTRQPRVPPNTPRESPGLNSDTPITTLDLLRQVIIKLLVLHSDNPSALSPVSPKIHGSGWGEVFPDKVPLLEKLRRNLLFLHSQLKGFVNPLDHDYSFSLETDEAKVHVSILCKVLGAEFFLLDPEINLQNSPNHFAQTIRQSIVPQVCAS